MQLAVTLCQSYCGTLTGLGQSLQDICGHSVFVLAVLCQVVYWLLLHGLSCDYEMVQNNILETRVVSFLGHVILEDAI